MTGIQVPRTLRRVGVDDLLTDEVGYHRLIQWLATLDPLPLRRMLGLPEGDLTVQREVRVDDKCSLDLAVYVNGIPVAVAQVTLGMPTRVDYKWVYDQWCSVRNIAPRRRRVLSLTGDVIAAWADDPGWQSSVSILGLLAAWRDTSELVFVRELAKHAHALAEEVVLQARGTLAHLETAVARSLVAQQLRVTFRETYPAGSGIEFPAEAVDTAGAVRASLWVPAGSGSGSPASLHVEPRGGAHAKAGCRWTITVLAAAAAEPSTDELVPTLDAIRRRLEELGLNDLVTRLSEERLQQDGSEIAETFRSLSNASIRRWRRRFRSGQPRSTSTRRTRRRDAGVAGSGIRVVVDNSLTVDELQTVALVVAEMLRTSTDRGTATAASTGPETT